MATTKKLSLKIERLAEISNDDLARLGGGAGVGVVLTGTETYTCPTLPLGHCLTLDATNCIRTLRCTPIITPPTI